jgi:parallel beta-helix repeat protein
MIVICISVIVAGWSITTSTRRDTNSVVDNSSMPGMIMPAVNHEPIAIIGDDQLNSFPEKTGNGTAMYPYIIENLVIEGNYDGDPIYVANTVAYLIIQNCTIYNFHGCFEGCSPRAGIIAFNVSNIQITDNYVNGNDLTSFSANLEYNVGIEVFDSSSSRIARNTIIGTGQGIRLHNGCNNIEITGNDIHNNFWGIYVENNQDNMIWGNYFWNNVRQAVSSRANNTWDNGTYGNFWSDYPSRNPFASNDGMTWNTAQQIDGEGTGQQDNHPLVDGGNRPYVAWFLDTPGDIVTFFFFIIMAVMVPVLFFAWMHVNRKRKQSTSRDSLQDGKTVSMALGITLITTVLPTVSLYTFLTSFYFIPTSYNWGFLTAFFIGFCILSFFQVHACFTLANARCSRTMLALDLLTCFVFPLLGILMLFNIGITVACYLPLENMLFLATTNVGMVGIFIILRLLAKKVLIDAGFRYVHHEVEICRYIQEQWQDRGGVSLDELAHAFGLKPSVAEKRVNEYRVQMLIKGKYNATTKWLSLTRKGDAGIEDDLHRLDKQFLDWNDKNKGKGGKI